MLSMAKMIEETGEILPETVENVEKTVENTQNVTENRGLALDMSQIKHIFAQTAPIYYAAGLPVIPLAPLSKAAKLDNWASYHDHMPTEELRAQWLRSYPDGNIGLVLGAASGISMIDIDTEDKALADLLIAALPESPWVKIGKKGMTLAYRFNGLRSFRIKGKVGGMIIECLSSRTQTVMPPSIHPDTMRPYVSNCNLWDVLDKLVPLPLDIEEKLRTICVRAGHELSVTGYSKLSDRVSVGSRDVSITQRAGMYATFVMRGEKSLVEAADELRTNISLMVEDVAGDPVDPEKHVRNMIMFMKRDVLEKKKRLPKGWDVGLTDEQKTALGLDFGDNEVEWSANEMISYLKLEFEKHTAEGGERVPAIDRVLDQLKNTKSLSDLDQDRVLNYIATTNGMQIKMGTLRKALREKKKEEITGTTHGQIAESLIEDYQKISPLKFCKNKFWKWGGSHWVEIEKNEVIAKIIRDYGDLPAAKRWSDHNGIYGAMSALAAGPLATAHEFGVNFANGFLLRDMTLQEHNPEHGMLYTLPYRYMPEDSHRCVKWLKFLEDVWGHDEDYLDKVECLRDVMCITMFGLGTSMQRAVLLYGIPHSGKSQIMEVMTGLMDPSTVSAVAPKMWGDKFSPAGMLDKLMNMAGELDQNQKIPGANFKTMISGEEMEFQYKGQQNFKSRLKCTCWFGSNHLPRSDDDSAGFTRRWICLVFNKAIPVSKKIDRFGEMLLAEEREAICAWVMEAAHKFKEKSNPTFPKSHEQFVHEMGNIHNSVRMFLYDSGLVAGGAGEAVEMDEHTLHSRYWSWCVQTGLARPVSQHFFRGKAKHMEMDIGFKIVMRRNPKSGIEEAIYQGIEFRKP